MAKYRVGFHAYASISVEVEADDENQAADRAYEELPGGICAQCSGWNENWSLDIGDFEIDEDEEYAGKLYPAIELVED